MVHLPTYNYLYKMCISDITTTKIIKEYTYAVTINLQYIVCSDTENCQEAKNCSLNKAQVTVNANTEHLERCSVLSILSILTWHIEEHLFYVPGKSSQIPYEVDPITMLIVQMEKLERQRGNLPKVTLKKKKRSKFFFNHSLLFEYHHDHHQN